MTDRIGINLTSVDTTPKWGLGELYSQALPNEPEKIYRYIHYVNGAGDNDGVAGAAVYYAKPSVVAAESGYGALGTMVTMDFSDSVAIGAGVLQSAMTNNTYGWVQVAGIATISTEVNGASDGDSLHAGNITVNGGLGAVTAVTDVVCAYTLDASEKIVLCAFPY